MNVFFSDIKRGLKMWQFWFCVVLLIGIGIYNQMWNFMCNETPLFYEAYGFLGTLNRVLLSFYVNIRGYDEILLITGLFIFATVTSKEMKTGYFANQILRINYNKFIINRVLSTFVLGILAYTFALILSFIGNFIIDPNPSYAISRTAGPMGLIYDRSMWLYLFVNYINETLFIGAYSLLALGITLIWRNQYVGYIAPLLYYYFREDFLLLFVSRDFVRENLFLINRYIFNYQYPLWQTFLTTAIVFFIAGILIYIGFKRWKDGVW